MIKTNITEMFGITKPIFSAPMGPFYTKDLALAVSEAGGLGTLSNVNLIGKDPIKETIEGIKYLTEHTDKPFGYNILVARGSEAVKKFCVEVPQFILENTKAKEQCLYNLSSAGSSKILPSTQSFKKLRAESNIKHFHVAPALWLAEKCVKSGVDGIVVTGYEGGGHQSYEKVGSMVLLQQVKQKFPDIPKIACGGYATGEGLAAALSLGAGAIAMGSRFIASEESEFHEAYKNIIPPSKASDTTVVTGMLGTIRLWRNNYSLHHGVVASKEEKIKQEKTQWASLEDYMEDAKKYELSYNGNVEDGAVLLGQSIGIIDKLEHVSDIMDCVINDAEAALKTASGYIG